VSVQPVRVVDSHTGGEPTRLVLEGGPDLGEGPLDARLARFRAEHDRFRSAVVNEPRGSDALVGALLCPPHREGCELGVIFFNNVGYLGMCGHGAIGVVASLAALGRIGPGTLRMDTPVGAIDAELHADGSVSIRNVPSRRVAARVALKLAGSSDVVGDVAWGGNWFFLTESPDLALDLSHVEPLTDCAQRIREAANAQGFAEVDHVELFGPGAPGSHARSFVLCPGRAYDRSPCGTGTSAKLACLAADGRLGEGEPWVQESVIGSRFRAHYRWLDRARGEIAPVITGEAHVTAESVLRLDPRDPFCWGIRA
jgi:4-hydroxyproline epimerase